MDIKLKQNKRDFLLYRLVEYAMYYFFRVHPMKLWLLLSTNFSKKL